MTSLQTQLLFCESFVLRKLMVLQKKTHTQKAPKSCQAQVIRHNAFCLKVLVFVWLGFRKVIVFPKSKKTKYNIKNQHFKTQVFKPNAYCLQVLNLFFKNNELQKTTKTRKISKHKSSDPTHLYNTYKAQLKKKTNVYPCCYHMGREGRRGHIYVT